MKMNIEKTSNECVSECARFCCCFTSSDAIIPHQHTHFFFGKRTQRIFNFKCSNNPRFISLILKCRKSIELIDIHCEWVIQNAFRNVPFSVRYASCFMRYIGIIIMLIYSINVFLLKTIINIHLSIDRIVERWTNERTYDSHQYTM